jgi:hypothetical protein
VGEGHHAERFDLGREPVVVLIELLQCSFERGASAND